MSKPSRWPLPVQGIRFVAPGFLQAFLAQHPLTRACYPVAMGFYPKAQGHQMRRDIHDDNLLIYCIEGSGELETEHFDGGIHAGDVLILPKGCAHFYRAAQDDPWSIYWCHFSGSVSTDFINAIREYQPNLVMQLGHSSTLLASFTSMLGARQTGYSSAPLIHSANQLRQLLTLIPMELQAREHPKAHGLNVDKVQSIMWESLSSQMNLAALAESAKLSKHHFSAMYKKLTGYSPIKHFIHMKMEHACFLLDSTALSVGEIAAELGYDDALYFSRLFKKVLGMSPKNYRNSH